MEPSITFGVGYGHTSKSKPNAYEKLNKETMQTVAAYKDTLPHEYNCGSPAGQALLTRGGANVEPRKSMITTYETYNKANIVNPKGNGYEHLDRSTMDSKPVTDGLITSDRKSNGYEKLNKATMEAAGLDPGDSKPNSEKPQGYEQLNRSTVDSKPVIDGSITSDRKSQGYEKLNKATMEIAALDPGEPKPNSENPQGYEQFNRSTMDSKPVTDGSITSDRKSYGYEKLNKATMEAAGLDPGDSKPHSEKTQGYEQPNRSTVDSKPVIDGSITSDRKSQGYEKLNKATMEIAALDPGEPKPNSEKTQGYEQFNRSAMDSKPVTDGSITSDRKSYGYEKLNKATMEAVALDPGES